MAETEPASRLVEPMVGGALRRLECTTNRPGHAHVAVAMLVNVTTSLSLAEVKAHLSEIVGRVSGQHERITVTVYGKPTAVLVAPEDLDSLEETIAILSDPEAMSRLIASNRELDLGEGEYEFDLAAAMRHRSGAARGR